MEESPKKMRKMPDGSFQEVKHETEEPKTVRVTPKPPKEEDEQPELTPAQRIMLAITDTPDDRMSEMTFLSKPMAFYISLQAIQNPALVYAKDENGEIIDLLTIWERVYYKLSRSVGGEWVDMTSELARIQMTGLQDDGTMGSEM